MGLSLRIAVFWRERRNVEFQERFAGQTIPDDALEEAALLRDGLSDAGHVPFLVRWRPDDLRRVMGDLAAGRADLVFNASSLQEVCFLEAANIPYCGSGPGLVALDKADRKRLLMSNGVRTAPFVVVSAQGPTRGSSASLHDVRNGWEPKPPLGYPLFVKPVEGRGSAGVSDDSIVHDHAGLARQCEMIVVRLGQGALVETYLTGREVTVGVTGEPPRTLEPLEIEYNGAQTNSYEHKMDREIMYCPARVDGATAARVRETALDTFHALGARDFGRVDTIVDEYGIPTVLELNTFAGLHILGGNERALHASYMGSMAKATGITRGQLLGSIVDSACRRYSLGEHRRSRTSAGRDRRVAATALLHRHQKGEPSNLAGP